MAGNITDANNMAERGVQYLQTAATDSLSGAIEMFGRAVERTTDSAVSQFSNAVRDGRSISDVITNTIDTELSSEIRGDYGTERVLSSPRYAAEVLDIINPKQKFLFKVKINLSSQFAHLPLNGAEFSVKAIDKPKVTYDYDEVNMYNFRTKILRAMHLEPLTMTFHDDGRNAVTDLLEFYRLMMSPVSARTPEMMNDAELHGMSFHDHSDSEDGMLRYAATTGFLPANAKTVIASIEVIQIFANMTDFNVFTFMRPKITSMDYDGLDYSMSDGNEITVQFEYEALFVSYGNSDDRKQNTEMPQPYSTRSGGDIAIDWNNRADAKANIGVSWTPKPPTRYLMAGMNADLLTSSNAMLNGSGGYGDSLLGRVAGSVTKGLFGAAGAWVTNKASGAIGKAIMGSSIGKRFPNVAGAVTGIVTGKVNGVVNSAIGMVSSGVGGVVSGGVNAISNTIGKTISSWLD